MAKYFLLLLLLIPIAAFSQQLATLDRYPVYKEFIVHKHDTITLGKAITDSAFRYIYTNPGRKIPEYLSVDFGRSKVLVTQLERYVWKDDSSSVYAVIAVKNRTYYIDIDQAVDSGEVELSSMKRITPGEIDIVRKKKQVLFGKDVMSPVTFEGRIKNSVISCFIMCDDYREKLFADKDYTPRAFVSLNVDQMKQLAQALLDVQKGGSIKIAPNYKIKKTEQSGSVVYAFIKTNNEKNDPAGELFFLNGRSASAVSDAMLKFISKYSYSGNGN